MSEILAMNSEWLNQDDSQSQEYNCSEEELSSSNEESKYTV